MATPTPPITDHDDFERRLLTLREREKAHTREGDAIAAARRRLPMTEVPADTTVVGPDGEIPFADAFEGRDELVVYSHMFYAGEPPEWQCEGCTRNSWPMQHRADAAGINAYGITFAILAPGPYEEIAAFREFMGYTTPWYSTAHLTHPTMAHSGRLACYLRRDGRIHLTYWTTARGDEVLSPLFGILDRTAYGRREMWEDSPEGWPQLPTHSFLRTDEHGHPKGPRDGGRPPYQWTRIADTGTEGASRRQNLRVLEGRFALTRVTDARDVASGPDLLALVHGPDGGAAMHRDDTAEDAWVALWNGDDAHDPAATGMLSAIVAPLAAGELPVWTAASYDGDLVLVPAERLPDAVELLRRAGHHVAGAR